MEHETKQLEGGRSLDKMIWGQESIKYYDDKYVDFVLDPKTWEENDGNPIFNSILGDKDLILRPISNCYISGLDYDEPNDFIEM